MAKTSSRRKRRPKSILTLRRKWATKSAVPIRAAPHWLFAMRASSLSPRLSTNLCSSPCSPKQEVTDEANYSGDHLYVGGNVRRRSSSRRVHLRRHSILGRHRHEPRSDCHRLVGGLD